MSTGKKKKKKKKKKTQKNRNTTIRSSHVTAMCFFCLPTPEVVNEMNDDVDRGSAVRWDEGKIAGNWKKKAFHTWLPGDT